MRALLVLAVVVAAACGGKQSSPPATAPIDNAQPAPPADAAPLSFNEQAMASMRQFADDMCKCTESACVQQVADRMTQWSQKMANDPQAAQMKMSEAEEKEATEIGTRMGECMQKAMSASGSGATP